MKIYWAPQTRSTRIFWMLEEAAVDYEPVLIDIRAEARNDSAEFRQASPLGKVPAIRDGDVAMAESAAICLYLADRYAPGRLAPAADAAERGRYLFWTLYTPSVVEPAMAEKISNNKSNPVSHGWGDFGAMIAAWDEALEGRDWILGNSFSAADVMLGSSAIFLQMFDLLPVTRNIGRYAERCLARPAYQAAAKAAS